MNALAKYGVDRRTLGMEMLKVSLTRIMSPGLALSPSDPTLALLPYTGNFL